MHMKSSALKKGMIAGTLAVALAGIGVALFVLSDGPHRRLRAMEKFVRLRFPEVTQVSPATLQDWLTAEPPRTVQIWDVRAPEEYALSHLPGAIQVSPDATAEDLTESLKTAEPIVVYCSVGYRSSALATRLMEAGHTNIVNLEGSIFAWANQGFPLEAEGAPTNKVHPYGESAAGMLLQQYHPETY